MARKRITADDILDFRAKANELSQELEDKYEKLEKAAKPREDVENREWGILVIHHTDVDYDSVRTFVRAAKNAGYAAEIVEIDTAKKHGGPPERVIMWQKILDQAQLGYLTLSQRAARVAVVGTGDAVAPAVVLAEQYNVDALITVGGGPVMKAFASPRAFSKLAALAKNNLFSVVCPVLAIVPEDCGAYKPASISLYRDCSRSPRVDIDEYPGMSVPIIWTDGEQTLEKSIFGFIDSL